MTILPDMAIGEFALVWLLCVLAVYRIAHELVVKNGIFDLFFKLRTAVSMRWLGKWPEEFISCPICWSFPLAFIAALIFPWAGVVTYIFTSVSISGGVLIVHFVLYKYVT